VARRCDDTVAIEKKRVNFRVLVRFFFEGVHQPKKTPKSPGNAFFDVQLMSRLQNFAAGAAKKTALRSGFGNHALQSFNSSINHRIDLGLEKLFSLLFTARRKPDGFTSECPVRCLSS